jgi:uncharacterized protein YxjI
MKNYYLKQKLFSFSDQYKIYDENENLLYYIKGHVLSFDHKMEFYDAKNDKLIYHIRKKMISFLPFYYLEDENKEEVLTARKLFSPFIPQISIHSQKLGNLEIDGNYLGLNFSIQNKKTELANVKKKWLSWGDTYEITVFDQDHVTTMLALVIVIDSIFHRKNRN